MLKYQKKPDGGTKLLFSGDLRKSVVTPSDTGVSTYFCWLVVSSRMCGRVQMAFADSLASYLSQHQVPLKFFSSSITITNPAFEQVDI